MVKLCHLSLQVTEFVDLASGTGEGNGNSKQKTVILGESFGAMLGIRLGQLRYCNVTTQDKFQNYVYV